MKKYMLVYVDEKNDQYLISSDNYEFLKADYNIARYARGYEAELYEYDDMTMNYNRIM